MDITTQQDVLAHKVALRAVDLLPALPLPLRNSPVFRLRLTTTGVCLHLFPLYRTHLATEPSKLLRLPAFGQIDVIVTALAADGMPCSGDDDFPDAIHVSAALNRDGHIALLPSVLATLSSGRWPSPGPALPPHLSAHLHLRATCYGYSDAIAS